MMTPHLLNVDKTHNSSQLNSSSITQNSLRDNDMIDLLNKLQKHIIIYL